ncbi:hypothetical protein [Shimia sp. FJ5]|uniref:hypothetical protein n=1 Tax=Shimia sp. FJ5 TaxID=3079054 RepID=UPI002622DF35|nr:hypothetical protein [Shimia sp. FJ5]MDV4144125.1 hypothetical protein [Shimia sp. FJ5]
MIKPQILKKFIRDYWGYGDFTAPIWVVGMEEACDNTKEDFERRILTWSDRGEKKLDDAAGFHEAILDKGKTGLFRRGAKLQRTWAKLIRAYLAAYGEKTDTETARDFQIDVLGRSATQPIQTCFIELMPLPAPSTAKWGHVVAASGLECLQSRKEYLTKIAPKRVKALEALVREHRPKAVIFYGSTYQRFWDDVVNCVGAGFARLDGERNIQRAQNEHTVFFSIPHPVARGVKNIDYVRVGEEIRARLWQ